MHVTTTPAPAVAEADAPTAATTAAAPPRSPEAAFALTHTDSHLWQRYHAQHRAALRAVERAPLDRAAHSARALAAAAAGWTTMAYNEYRAAATMAQVAHAMTLAQAPFDLTSAACEFPGQELHHAHLCALLAARLGGAPRDWAVAPIAVAAPPPATSARMWAHQLVVVHLCVAESISFALLKAALKTSFGKCTHPVLKVLCRDEALHAELGWAYLDWAEPSFCADMRQQLTLAARAAVEGYRKVWKDTAAWGCTPEKEAQLVGLCLLTPSLQVEVGEQAIAQAVRGQLRDFDIFI